MDGLDSMMGDDTPMHAMLGAATDPTIMAALKPLAASVDRSAAALAPQGPRLVLDVHGALLLAGLLAAGGSVVAILIGKTAVAGVLAGLAATSAAASSLTHHALHKGG